MPTFHYRAAQADGTIIEGSSVGDTDAAVRTQLETQGLYVLSLEGRGSGAAASLSITKKGGLTLREFLVFNQQFLALVKSGLAILKTFDVLTDRATHPGFQKALQQVREKIRGGSSISEAMTAAPTFFPDLYRATVQSGEHTGNLVEVLQRYISYLKLLIGVREKVVRALAYPAFLILVGGAVMAFLIAFVIPTFSEVYEQSQTELPLPTQMLLDAVNHAAEWGPWAIAAIIVFAIGFHAWLKSPAGRIQADYILLHLPLLGKIALNNQIIRFSRTLATMLAGGIPLLTALSITASATTNRIISTAVMAASSQVRDGIGLSASLKKQGIFPRMTLEMIEVGESTGSLETMLQEIAEFHEGELDLQISQFTTWIEPVLLLVMGVMVGGIVIIMYLPIFQLAGTV